MALLACPHNPHTMDNRGKLWTIDDDQKLMEQPDLPNSYFVTTMGRTENAIRCRRCHLAAKMHQNDPQTSLEEFSTLMRADFAQASALLDEWNQKRSSIKNSIDNHRKRKLVITSAFVGAAAAGGAPAILPQVQPPPTEAERITQICKRICDEGGNLTSLWHSQEYLPTLVQHYGGFEAYARVIRVLSASGH